MNKHSFSSSILSLIILFILRSCSYPKKSESIIIKDGEKLLKISLKSTQRGTSILSKSEDTKGNEYLISEWKLYCPTFYLECADVDRNGKQDILVGVIKSTRFDTVVRKRIFIFKLLDGLIRPLWLGSAVSHPLEKFRALSSAKNTVVRTIEKEADGSFLVAEYEWKTFGLSFNKYIVRNVNYTKGLSIFNQTETTNENS